MAVGGWLRELDDDALAGRLTGRFAHPQCTSWQAWWALAGVAYGVAIGGWFLLSIATFDHVQRGDLLLGLAIGAPWPAVPLVWGLRRGRLRTGGWAATALATAHFLMLLGSWGVELLYVPLVLIGLMVAVGPARQAVGTP